MVPGMGLLVWVGIGVAALVLGVLSYIFTAKSVLPDKATTAVSVDGQAQRLQGRRSLIYRVATRIDAPPARVWALLTDASGFAQWNSEVLSIEGQIAEGERIKLRAKIAPKRVFPLNVTRFEPHRHMVWEDGNRIFRGVRNFELKTAGDSTEVFMTETFTGAMLPMIAPSLPDFGPSFENYMADLKKAAERAQ